MQRHELIKEYCEHVKVYPIGSAIWIHEFQIEYFENEGYIKTKKTKSKAKETVIETKKENN
jgi:hypothetical protein